MTRRPPRRGIASLELVFVFPALLMLVVGLFVISRVTLDKLGAVNEARREAWPKRAAADPGRKLHLENDPARSKVDQVARVEYRPGLYFGSRAFRGDSRSHPLGRPWDHDTVPFVPGRGPFKVHDAVVTLVMENYGGAGVVVPGLELLGKLLNVAGNPLLQALGAVSQGLKYGADGAMFVLQAARFTLFPAAAVASVFVGRPSWVRLMALAMSSVGNLADAMNEKAGDWPSDMPRRVRRATP